MEWSHCTWSFAASCGLISKQLVDECWTLGPMSCEEKIQKILDTGVNAIFTTKGIDDFAMKYLVEVGSSVRGVPPLHF